MSISEPFGEAFRAAGLRAYERGRMKGALVRGGGVFVLGFPAYLACGRTPAAALCLLLLAIVSVAARYTGMQVEQGARAGIIAGIVPCLLPAALRLVNPDLCETLFTRGPWLCAATGIAAGLLLGFRTRAATGTVFWGTAIVALALAATLGCIPAGAMGFSGLVIGVLIGGLPALAARRLST